MNECGLMSEEEPYVTKSECIRHVTELENNLEVVKKALCGDDLRGGLVRDINKIFTEIALLKNAIKKNGTSKEWSKKQWGAIGAAIVAGAFSIIDTVIGALG
jgi:hypothetical protein